MKTKVIAFRVTEDEYEALQLRVKWCKQSESMRHVCTVSDLVNDLIRGELSGMLYGLARERKRVEAKAKRDAKKAATDVVQ